MPQFVRSVSVIHENKDRDPERRRTAWQLARPVVVIHECRCWIMECGFGMVKI